MDSLRDVTDDLMIDGEVIEDVEDVAFVVPSTPRFGASSLSLFAQFPPAEQKN
jgi:hypothetical protein